MKLFQTNYKYSYWKTGYKTNHSRSYKIINKALWIKYQQKGHKMNQQTTL